MPRYLAYLLLTCAHALIAPSYAQDALTPQNATWEINLKAVWGVSEKNGKQSAKDLNLWLHLVNGEMAAGVGYARNFNRAGHWVNAAKVTLTGDQAEVEFDATLYPDRWVPADGKAVPVKPSRKTGPPGWPEPTAWT
jgi:hypothetical protein